MGIGHQTTAALGRAVPDFHAGGEKLASRKLAGVMKPGLAVSSPELGQGGRLPLSCTVDGAGMPPTLEWAPIPQGTRSFVVLCEDPDAPFPKPFVHWLVYGIRPTARSIDTCSACAACQGKNTKLVTGFTPAAPPPGHGVHHYHFQVFALDIETDLDVNLCRSALLDAMSGHVLGWGELVGTYERK